MSRVLVVLSVAFLLLSCAVAVTPQSTGGSRADGTIEMSYQYGALTIPEPDWITAGREASQRCQNWGYTSAETFGTGVQSCVSADFYGNCNTYRVTQTYQCSGQPDVVR